jgi:hypothetical protein
MKNNTRIASLLGTWTGETHLKTDIGSYELSAYFVIHFMPDPTREYACTLPNCSEFQNHICKWDMNTKKKQCIDLTTSNESLDWSDINAFIYFGAKVVRRYENYVIFSSSYVYFWCTDIPYSHIQRIGRWIPFQ